MAATFALTVSADAACIPPAVDATNPPPGTAVTCTGITTNQNVSAGYGTTDLQNLTVTVDAGAAVTGTGSRDGILVDSGTVINRGTVTSVNDAIASWTRWIDVTNYGSITASNGSGVYGEQAARLVNQAGAAVSGTFGVRSYNAIATVINSGSITGAAYAVFGEKGVAITNNTGGLLSGNIAVGIQSGTASIVNYGTMSGTAEAVDAQLGTVDITNYGTLAASSGTAIFAGAGSGRVFNAGTITGATAIQFSGAGNVLTLAPGSAITGNVLGAGSDTFQLGGTGAATFDVSMIGAQYTGFSTFTKVDSSIWTLTGTPGQSTSWNINGGTLVVDSDSTLGAGNEALAFNGGLLWVSGTSFTATARPISLGLSGGTIYIADAANTLDVTQGITGPGWLVKAGPGTMVLSGLNTYSGSTNVTGGTLRQGTAGAFSAASTYAISAGASLDLGGFTTTIGSLASAGTVSLGSATLTAGGDNSSTTFSGRLTGSGGLTKTGTGRMNLTGLNSYSGATTVDAGTLSVNGSISSSAVTVNAGGTLGGTGVVGNTTINGGALAPGNSIGTLTVFGNLVLTAASSFMVEVSTASADGVGATGSATLGGATVNASFAAGSYVSSQYIIVHATGGVIGTFGSQVNTNLPANFTSSLAYDTNNAYLKLTLNYVPPPTPTPTPTPTPDPAPAVPGFNAFSSNQRNVADALVNFFNRSGGIPLAFGALDANGLTQASGETATGSQQTTFDAMTLFMGLMTDPFTAGRGVDAAAPFGYGGESGDAKHVPSDALAMITRAMPPAPTFEARWNVWAAGFGGAQTTDGSAATGSNTASSRIFGAAVGADYQLSRDTTAGFSMAGGGTNFSVAGGGSGRSDLFQAGGFVRHSVASAYISAAAAYGWQDVTTDRNFGGSLLRGRFNANSYSGRVEAGNRYVVSQLGGAGLTPYTALEVAAFDLPGVAENATSGPNMFALSYSAETVTTTRSELGLRSDKALAVSDAMLVLRGRAAWAHDFNTGRSASATFQSLPGTSFVVDGARPASDAALATAEAELRFASGISVGASFGGEFSEVTRSYVGKGIVRYAW